MSKAMETKTIKVKGMARMIEEIEIFQNAASLLIAGEAGVGKTYMMERVAERLGAKLFVERMSGMTEELMQGIPMFSDDGTSFGLAKMSFLDYIANNPDEKIMLFIDEINRTPKRLKPALFSLLEKNIDGIHYPNLIVISALNLGDDYEENWDIGSDAAFLSRTIVFEYTPDNESAFEHFEAKKYNRFLIEALGRGNTPLVSSDRGDALYEQTTNYRTWYKLNEALENTKADTIEKAQQVVRRYGHALMTQKTLNALVATFAIMAKMAKDYDIDVIVATGKMPDNISKADQFELIISIKDHVLGMDKGTKAFLDMNWVPLLVERKDIFTNFCQSGVKTGKIPKEVIPTILRKTSGEAKDVLRKIMAANASTR